MRALVPFLLLLASCSTTIDDSCPTVVNQGWSFEYCQEATGEVWPLFTQDAWRVARAFDEASAPYGIEPVAPHLVGASVELRDRSADDPRAGYFAGYHDRDPWRIVLMLPTDEPYQLADNTPLAHELFHAIEKNIFEVDLYDLQRAPGHFLHDALARDVLGSAASAAACAFTEPGSFSDG